MEFWANFVKKNVILWINTLSKLESKKAVCTHVTHKIVIIYRTPNLYLRNRFLSRKCFEKEHKPLVFFP